MTALVFLHAGRPTCAAATRGEHICARVAQRAGRRSRLSCRAGQQLRQERARAHRQRGQVAHRSAGEQLLCARDAAGGAVARRAGAQFAAGCLQHFCMPAVYARHSSAVMSEYAHRCGCARLLCNQQGRSTRARTHSSADPSGVTRGVEGQVGGRSLRLACTCAMACARSRQSASPRPRHS